MRFRHFARTCAVTAALVLASALPAPALAHGDKHHFDDYSDRPDWQDRRYDDARYGPDFDGARADWLDDCRRRISDSGVGGAVIGGMAGGLIGNRIAGRGDRTVGTVAGAAVGAVAGAAIDRAEDRRADRDACEAYLDEYYADYHGGPEYGYSAYGYGYPAHGYAVPMVMVPVMVRSQKPCVETVVTEEYVTAPARRHIRRAPRPDKRIRIAPDKRVPLK